MDDDGITTRTRSQQRNILQTTVQGFFWMLSGAGLQSLVQLGALAILARLLTPTDFGVVGAAMVVVGFAEIFYRLGIGPALVQRSDLDDLHIRTGFTFSLLLGATMCAATSAAAPLIASFFRMEELTNILRIMSLGFLIQGFTVVARSLAQRNLRFRLLAATDTTSYFIGYLIVAVPLGRAGFGPWALAGGFIGTVFIRSTILAVSQRHALQPLLNGRRLKQLLRFGTGHTLAQICNQAALQVDNVVVGRTLGAVALGVYGRAYSLMAVPATVVGRSLDIVLFPAMAAVQESRVKLSSAFRRGSTAVGLIVLPISVLVMILAPELVLIALGQQWEPLIPVIQVMAAGMLFRTGYKVGDSVAQATGAVYARAWRQLLYATAVGLGAWAGHHRGLTGVGIGVVCALGAYYLLTTQLALKLTGVSWREFGRIHVPGIRVAAVMGFACWGTASVIRGMTGSAALVLLGATMLVTAFGIFMVRSFPRGLLGTDGIWVLGTAVSRAPAPVRRMVMNGKHTDLADLAEVKLSGVGPSSGSRS